jgi:phage shock protein PspC (stress-responsive transcriptional regulator)
MRPRRLVRSRHGILGGVCAGIAEYFGWSPFAVRLMYVIVSIFSAAFPGIIVYIILWILMPRATADDYRDLDTREYRVS